MDDTRNNVHSCVYKKVPIRYMYSRIRPEDPMTFKLAAMGTVFSTRSRGARTLREVIASLPEDDHVVELDFDEVRSVSYSFADEFVGTMRSAVANGELELEIRLCNMEDDVERIVHQSLRNRGVLTTS